MADDDEQGTNHFELLDTVHEAPVEFDRRATKSEKRDRSVVRAALAENGAVLAFVLPRFQADNDLVFVAVGNHGQALRFAHDGPRDDALLARRAIKNDHRAFQYASPTLRNSLSLARLAMREPDADESEEEPFAHTCPSSEPPEPVDETAMLAHAGPAVTSDRELVLSVVRRNGLRLAHAAEWLRNNYVVCLAAVQQNSGAYRFMGPTTRDIPEIAFSAFEKDGTLLAYATETVADDYALVRAAAEQEPAALRYASERIRDDLDFVLSLRSADAASVASERVQRVPEVHALVKSAIEARRARQEYYKQIGQH